MNTADIANQNGKSLYINLDLPENRMSIEERRHLRKIVNKYTMDHVNSNCVPVSVRNSFYTRYVKRFVDILISATALTILLPVNLVIGIITFFDVGMPIFFKQERVGKDGKPFFIVKFRNMTNETDAKGVLLPPSERVTKWGKFVRRTSLDELLNFWSILKGDMSVIGPRPLPMGYSEDYSRRHQQRHKVRPGLECPPICPKTGEWTWTDQLENDIRYVETVSLKTDIMQTIRLFGLVFNRKSTSVRGNATNSTFMGYHMDGSCISSKEFPLEYANCLEEMGYVIRNGKVEKLERV